MFGRSSKYSESDVVRERQLRSEVYSNVDRLGVQSALSAAHVISKQSPAPIHTVKLMRLGNPDDVFMRYLAILAPAAGTAECLALANDAGRV
jgi:hypothetical protein